MRTKIKIGDVAHNISENNKDLTVGRDYTIIAVDAHGFYFKDDKGDTRHRARDDRDYRIEPAAVRQSAPKLPRLEVQAAPQGGFLVIAPSVSMGTLSETLSAHSTLDEALAFVRTAMA